ncbi:hypothetical protein BH10BDE1_BH10BDE1_00750 [soil metagenome]
MLGSQSVFLTHILFLLGLSVPFFGPRVSWAGDANCIVSYASIEALATHEGQQPLEQLVAFESLLESAEKSIDASLHDLHLSAVDRSKLASSRHSLLADIRVQFEGVSDGVLSESPERLQRFNHDFSTLRQRLIEAIDFKKTTGAAVATTETAHPFHSLIETPSLLKTGVTYEVPQAAGHGGEASIHKVSTTFSQDVLDYFKADATRGSRFLRAIQKGYVPSGSGSGIVRITDQHEKLVEIKVIGGNEGHQRLIGCRQADGLIHILKVYEKRNEGGGGSLKRYASLCD